MSFRVEIEACVFKDIKERYGYLLYPEAIFYECLLVLAIVILVPVGIMLMVWNRLIKPAFEAWLSGFTILYETAWAALEKLRIIRSDDEDD